MEEPEVANDYKKTVFSRLSVEITHMISHWLGQHAQDLCKVKPDQVPAGREKVGTKPTLR